MLRASRVLLLLLGGGGAAGAASDCQTGICPSGTSVIYPDQTVSIGDNPLTCSRADAYARAGCYDDAHCGFLQGYAKATCCGETGGEPQPSIEPATSCPDDFYAGNNPVCAVSDIGTICIDSVFNIICEASLDDQVCKSCVYTYASYNSLGYELDCSNVRSSYSEIDVYGDTVIVKNKRSSSSSSDKNKRSSSSSSDDDDGFPLILFFLFVVSVGLRIARLTRPCWAVNHSPVPASAVELADVRPIQISASSTSSNANDESIPIVAAQAINPSTRTTTTSSNANDESIPIVAAQAINPSTRTTTRSRTSPDMIERDVFANALYKEALEGRLETFHRDIERFREGKWAERCCYIVIVAEYYTPNAKDKEETPWEDLLKAHVDELVQSQSGGAVSALYLVQGFCLVDRAWEIRGTGWARDVSREAWNPVQEKLAEARDAFLKGAALDPTDPTPYAFLQTIGMALDGRDAAVRWLAEALKRDPFNFVALDSHRYTLMQKWHGNYPAESMHFAQAVTEKCPKTQVARVVLIKAFKEQFRDAAWSREHRLRLAATPWVKEATLSILRDVYADNPEPPVNTLPEKLRFNNMMDWLKILVTLKVIDLQGQSLDELRDSILSRAQMVVTEIV